MVPFTNHTADRRECRRWLRPFVRLRGCPGIAQLVAFVTDQDNFYLRGYCFQSTVSADVGAVLSIAKRLGRPVSWSTRLQWIREILVAIAETYDRKFAIGRLRIIDVSLGQDHHIVLYPAFLHELGLTELTFTDQMNQVLSEGAPRNRNTIDALDLHQRKAMFQLSQMIWQIAEQVDPVGPYLCERASCTSKPRYLCSAKHTNPQYLPSCVDAPSFMNDIFRICRSQNINQRPTACEILNMLSQCSKDSSEAIGLDSELAWHIRGRSGTFLIYCDERGDKPLPDIDCYYHCSACSRDDFDLCRNCYDKKGTRCYNSNHFMTKMIMRDGVSYALT